MGGPKHNVSKIESTYVKQHEYAEKRALRRKKGLVRRLVLFGIFVSIISVAVISTLISQAEAMNEKKKEKEQLEEELSTLEGEQENLKEEIRKLNDEDYIIKIARRDYFLSNDGEVIFKLPD
ncbi:septum formation initiator family protein [Bacillus marinisedimentorum]|uniref:septum formation initiator family protein n=1 Tax=Bacillus marinisedimentorum TaxID=1821260 RepID=UPI0008733396|nr:septum formation initiator family protein [Bacillus marinisedimentorum]